MNKKVFVLVIIGIVTIFIIAMIFLLTEKIDQVCFRNHCFNVELAIEIDEQMRGLMFREHLDPDKGMLFIFKEEKKHSFWMKNVLIPLDIIWINNDKEVVFINENTQPCEESICSTIKPIENAKYVLEINGGISEKIGLVVGDQVWITYFNY